MQHYIAYHNAERMGHSDIERLRVYTSRSVDEKMIGDRIWLIAGVGIKSSKQYSLASTFLVEEVSNSDIGEFKWCVAGFDGRIFNPPIPLDDLPWFPEFMKAQQNFSLGLREIGDARFIHQLEKTSRA